MAEFREVWIPLTTLEKNKHEHERSFVEAVEMLEDKCTRFDTLLHGGHPMGPRGAVTGITVRIRHG